MRFDGNMFLFSKFVILVVTGVDVQRKGFESPLLLLLHGSSIRVDFEAKSLCREILVLAVDETDSLIPHHFVIRLIQ